MRMWYTLGMNSGSGLANNEREKARSLEIGGFSYVDGQIVSQIDLILEEFLLPELLQNDPWMRWALLHRSQHQKIIMRIVYENPWHPLAKLTPKNIVFIDQLLVDIINAFYADDKPKLTSALKNINTVLILLHETDVTEKDEIRNLENEIDTVRIAYEKIESNRGQKIGSRRIDELLKNI